MAYLDAAIEWGQRYRLLPDDDLCISFIRRDSSASRAARLSANTAVADDDAAARSEHGCEASFGRGTA